MSKKNMRERCKETYRFLRSVDALYHWIGLGSLVVLLFKVAVLNCIPAPLHFMSAVSPVVEGILGSVIASYIFYMFCIHPPVFAEKKTSAAFVNFILTRIKKGFDEHLRNVSSTLSYDSTEQDFYATFTGINPFARNAPLLLQAHPKLIYADWFEFFQNHNVHIKKEISRLLDSRLTLDIETIYILNLINDCSWFMITEKLAGLKGQMTNGHNPFVNPNQPAISCCSSMYELKEFIRSLQPAIDATDKLAGRV
ncbi:hypothetical protein ACPSVR_004173 [Yersinia enterocolitica]|uniref:hypothetical protein n=1 Tax=Lelliottia sp. RWM.1 TaxID=2663242 RepID=UPI00193EA384|nr:hypothetical protein [Lelliottia sp. RWM.1]EKN3387400.1 hypothetical protein [Yersinia enterocolitica]EKN3769150.1 hypothetical protein [Yersinia enterocolitica]EKN4084130.1 hypothetical protein [Yersinia enterocolitica]ELY5225153.1 hypothetical protein [Yersinia enterocolitica]EMB6557884.1 hypothetical protein [Yersinia enterocolitica]